MSERVLQPRPHSVKLDVIEGAFNAKSRHRQADLALEALAELHSANRLAREAFAAIGRAAELVALLAEAACPADGAAGQ